MGWHIGDSTQAANGLGIMELPRRKQELVIAANDVDEELMVSSLLAFLEAITLRHPDVKCDWSARRRNLKANFGTSDLRAIVDGALVGPRNNDVKAMIEAKRERSQGFGKDIRVTWQQLAEVVTAIRTQNLAPGTPVFLISQEADELFLLAGTFGEEYLDYISGRTTKLASKDSLRLERFGPWEISNAEHLKTFAGIALAIAIQGSK
ncbi:hypothetical protein N7536_000893 [Penicillium majusculum]|uniref:Uncharacterized protein n=1 Tax=Penicillium solitum TaxID=60172 RepID=A0A1V6R6U2_9EURO|nr:uncharacterized protein PENSOL_c013G10820 [Penicillium solitum]KAJ5705204.1 hypothetical protein N7536_000893 [Penicillium majusculum]OQD97229.1 hypothetical protein PENSOL_c013G10820 [Penicillium solitum]